MGLVLRTHRKLAGACDSTPSAPVVLFLPRQGDFEPPSTPRALIETIAGPAFWSLASDRLLSDLKSTTAGLQPADAAQRLKQHGPNTIKAHQQVTALGLFLNQFRSSLVLILIFAAIVSLVGGEITDAVIVLAIVVGSTALGFVQAPFIRCSDGS